MAKYRYVAKTRDAKTVRETVEAVSKADLITKLKAQGLFLVSVHEVKDRLVEGGLLSLFGRARSKRSSIKSQDLAFLARNLSITLSSGVTLLRSLEILSFQAESAGLEKILKECAKAIKGGLSFSESIAKYPKIFPALWRGLVEVGEASGNLPLVLEKLAGYLEIRMDFERKVKSALIYPVILLIIAALAMLIFFKFVLPKFTAIFKQFDITLPVPTQILFNISELMEKNFLLVLGAIALSVAGLMFFIKSPATKAIWESVKLKIPIMGKVVFLSCLERLTSTIHILLDSGLPLIHTLEIAARSMDNSVLERNLNVVRDKVRDGASLSSELARLNIFPLLISEMAKIGEETGSMPQIFSKIAAHYQRELTTRIERMIAAFEPVMITVMGAGIGAVVVSLFLPLFKISTIGGGP